MKLFILLCMFSLKAFAQDLANRPLPFTYQNEQAVFVDMLKAHYEINYDFIQKKANVVATIEFENGEKGFPIFDSHTEPTKIILNGNIVSSTLTETPSKETSLRVINESLNIGRHSMTIELPLTLLVEFTETGVKSAFWMSDLTERGYLERYLPTNFLFDRIPTTFKVRFLNSPSKQRVYTNATSVEVLPNEFELTFADGLNASCHYFHTSPVGTFAETLFSYKSLDGRDLPVVIYVPVEWENTAETLARVKNNTIKIMDELEQDYGAFPHASLTIYVNGPSGGMEYSGATITSESALGHELFHSYYARGVLHSDGNSGWIDEALARWRDNGYKRISSLSGTSNLANHPYYNRVTDRQAYSFGERFMALLDNKTALSGGLKPFLRETVARHTFEPMNTASFIQKMDAFYGTSFDADFKQYVFGQGLKSETIRPPTLTDEIHRQFTLKELQELL